MNLPKVSIVIPIYNVERYLDRCLNSIVNQTYRELEIILIDDGSPDNCPLLCDEWAKKDERIKVVHKKNAGLGMARNSGIEVATGKYIYFCDSDDYIDLTTIEKCVNSAEKYNSDMVLFLKHCVDRFDQALPTKITTYKREFYSGENLHEIMIGGSAWSRMISLNKIKDNNWRFVSERNLASEDYFSTLELWQYIKSVSTINEPLYVYCENPVSLSHSIDKTKFERIKNCHKAMIELCEKLKYPQTSFSFTHYSFYTNIIALLKIIAQSKEPFTKRYAKLKHIVEDDYLQNQLEKIKTQQWNPLPYLQKIFIKAIEYKCPFFVFLMARFKKQ